ncbi:MAG: MaoC family dehydratase [Cyclobacteriaceae bacterium]|nr:MaoC family dehydratase [Cyclobacteriaceae bacterium]
MPGIELDNLTAFRQLEGTDLPIGSWHTVSQAMIDSFADATDDRQWIHVDAGRAASESPFGATIAHGFLSLSLLSRLIRDLFTVKSVRMAINYGVNKVRFPSAVVVGSKIRLLARPIKIEEYPNNGVKITWDCKVELQDTAKPAVIAEYIILMFE